MICCAKPTWAWPGCISSKCVPTRPYILPHNLTRWQRQALSLPPFSYQAVLRADAPNREPVEHFMQRVAAICQHYGAPDLSLLGPLTPVMERRAGRHRMFFVLQCPQRMRLQHYLQQLLPAIDALTVHHSLRWHLDVDPQEIAG